MNRRNFLEGAAASSAILACFRAALSGVERNRSSSGLERRSLGKTGEKLSILGFGGIVVMDATPKEAEQRVGEAIDYGVNYFDVAPSYGNAEQRLGPALQPYRKNVFLACKTLERGKQGANSELKKSLNNLHTDHFDLYQLHAVTKPQDVKTILAPGGALEALVDARKAGKVRFLGFSAHSVEAALALMQAFNFDTILFPVNYATWYAGNFGPQVLQKAQDKKMGILALKAMARGPYAKGVKKTRPKSWYQPLEDPLEALQALRFTLSHPVTAAIPPGDENLYRIALDLGRKFVPFSTEETEAIKAKALRGDPLFRYPSKDAV